MIVFHLVRFKNFRSYGNTFTEIKLDKSKTTLISAPNGSGKSTILMAIEFGLFGRVTAGINKGDLVNSINGGDTIIEIEFTAKGKQVLVRRGLKPNIFEIYIDGKMLNQTASVKEQQNFFENEILGFNINNFRSVVSISGSNHISFFNMSSNQRRNLVEEILDLTVFSKMHILHLANIARTRDELKEIEAQIEKEKASLKSLKKGLESLQSQEEDYRATIKENIVNSETQIEELEKERVRLKKKKQELLKEIDNLQAVERKRKNLESVRIGMESQLKKIEKKIQFLKETEQCPTCQQKIDEDMKQKELSIIQNKHGKINESLPVLDQKLQGVEKAIQEFKQIQERIRKIDSQIEVINHKIENLRNYIHQQKELLNSKNENADNLKAEIKVLVQQHEESKKKRLDILERKQYNDLISAVIKDNGIKSRIIRQYIGPINQCVNRYLNLLDMNASFSMDESFSEKIYSRFKDAMTYQNFSAGERARIDIAMLFTWREIAKMKNAMNCNLLFLDEIFDSVLDDNGLEAFINLLTQLEDTNVFLISHRPEISDKLESVLKIEKQGSFSKIE